MIYFIQSFQQIVRVKHLLKLLNVTGDPRSANNQRIIVCTTICFILVILMIRYRIIIFKLSICKVSFFFLAQFFCSLNHVCYQILVRIYLGRDNYQTSTLVYNLASTDQKICLSWFKKIHFQFYRHAIHCWIIKERDACKSSSYVSEIGNDASMKESIVLQQQGIFGHFYLYLSVLDLFQCSANFNSQALLGKGVDNQLSSNCRYNLFHILSNNYQGNIF